MGKRPERVTESSTPLADIEAPPAPERHPFSQLMTTKDIANYLNVSRSTVHRMVEQGQIPYCMVRGRRRFDARAVMAALDRHR